MSFHGLVETLDRSACVTSDPSGSRRSSCRCAESTTSSRPSGRKSIHIGNDATVTTTSRLPSVPSAITWFAPQSENQSCPSCQRGDSPNTTPSIRTSAAPTFRLLLADGLVRQTASGSRTHRTPPAPPRPHPESAPPPPPWPAPAEHLARLEAHQLNRPLAIEVRAARETLKARHHEDRQTRTARAPVLQRVPNGGSDL